MEERQIRAIFINGSPRKNKNTFQMLEKAMLGAKEEGAITEMINLYELNFKGCKSCFACDTYQFNDYSKYAVNVFNEEAKRKQRDEHFPVDMNNACELGRRLVKKAMAVRD